MKLGFLIIIVLFIIIFNDCNVIKIDKKGIIFDLSYTKISDSEYKIDGAFINRSIHPVAVIFLNNTFTNITRPTPYLFLNIKLDDSVYVEGHELLFKMRIPTKDDYTIVKVGEKIDIHFIIDFKNMIIRNQNNFYDFIKAPKGNYSLQLTYLDKFMKHPLAIDSIKSNKIFLNWK